MKKYIYLFVTFLFFSKIGLSQMTGDEIIAKHLEITGLMNASNEIKYYSIEGEINQNKMKFPIKIQAKIPDKFRMDMMFNNLGFIKISNGNNTWEYNPMSDTLITKAGDGSEALDFIDRWTGGLSNYKGRGLKIRLIGEDKIEDIEVYKLEVVFSETARVYFIDKFSYLIHRIDDDANGNKITYYSDFRKTGNYMLPYRMDGFEKGVPSISMQFKTVQFNTEIVDSTFSKPSKEQ